MHHLLLLLLLLLLTSLVFLPLLLWLLLSFVAAGGDTVWSLMSLLLFPIPLAEIGLSADQSDLCDRSDPQSQILAGIYPLPCVKDGDGEDVLVRHTSQNWRHWQP